MIAAAVLGEIVQTYSKHGWILRRVLLTDSLHKSLGANVNGLFGDARIIRGVIDAAWFSRPPKKGAIAWEIRILSETPYALLEYVDENADNFEDKLREVESRLAAHVASGVER